jgi:energy-coupling factor transporter ATP-binding protein EcfA2
VIRSDHHSVEELSRGEAKTYVKVARHDFASVRDALRFFETRVRYHDDLPKTPSPRLVGLRLRSPSGAGLFESATIAFNPNLNCVIGSRGSGKSTIIEALRYALGLNGALIELPAAGNGQVNFAEIALRTQRANLKDTLIEIVYEIEGARYVLSSTYDAETDVTTATFELDGGERKIAAEALPVEFPVRLYSWSEIETLGREPDLQRRLLDRLITQLPRHNARRNQLLADLATNRNDIRGECQRLATLLRADNGLLRRYTQYKQDFERINTPEVSGLFADLDQARERLGLLESTKEVLDDLRRDLESVADSADSLLRRPAEGDIDADLLQWWESEIAPVLALEPAREETTRLIEQALALTDARRSALDSLIETEGRRVSETEAALRARTQAAPEEEVRRGQREERKARFDRANERRQEYLDAFDRLKAKLTERNGLARALEQTQEQIATLRGDSRAELLDRLAAARTGMDIGIELSVGSDRRRAVAFMRDTEFLTFAVFGQYKAKQVAERCCGMASPVQIVRAILAKDQHELEHDKKLDEDGALTAEEGAKLVEHFYPFSRDDAADVDIVDETLISTLELEEQGIEDELRIVLNGRPVDRLSPGQRSSAMLPLVALSETAPLIIDQPEDNLDNRMVGETLTQILADLKERRQIIVTTHNPNIVVGGDAEQVVVVDATAAHAAVVERTGSVDDSAIIDAVVGIMEGGREAFLMRERRYGLAT